MQKPKLQKDSTITDKKYITVAINLSLDSFHLFGFCEKGKRQKRKEKDAASFRHYTQKPI